MYPPYQNVNKQPQNVSIRLKWLACFMVHFNNLHCRKIGSKKAILLLKRTPQLNSQILLLPSR